MRLGALLLAVLLLASCRQEGLTYDDGRVVAHGWSGDAPPGGWESILTVRASDAEGSPPLAGSYRRRGGTIIFTPAFPPSPEVTLRITYRGPRGIESLTVPGKAPVATAATQVTAIYPTTEQWPANQLRFYIHFSGPMTRGVAYRHIQLLDDAGNRIEQPFVEFDQELWDPGVRRLTVLFDPGRIKRGLGDTEPPLVPGRRYILRIDPAWPDASGRPLAGAFERRIAAVEEVRLPVDPKAWTVTPPKSRDGPLVIDFPRPLDNALARRTISVPGMEGDVDLQRDETRWVFQPARRWERGEHQIRVDGILEDLAGNRLHRLFDVDTSKAAQNQPPPKFDTLSFRVE